MKRLTHRYEDGQAWVNLDLVSKMGENECVGLPVTKLATYEDLEEQGLLLKLPCKVGDAVYFIKSAFSYMDKPHKEQVRKIELICDEIIFRTDNRSFGIEKVNKTVFLTQSEAEQALKRMEREE